MQQSITPCQRSISDRFPVASFVVNLPPNRLFEIVCATDPSLFRTENRHSRAQSNFFTSRGAGLLRAPAGHATYLLPPDQLRRFAGKQRLYFTLASYGNARGDDAELSIPVENPAAIPSIRLSADFTGKTLDRSRIRNASRGAKYGASNVVLTWGGDAVASRRAEAAVRTPAYDDGYSPELWKGRSTALAAPSSAPEVLPPPPQVEARAPLASSLPDFSEPAYEEMGLSEAYGRPVQRKSEPRRAATAAPAGEPPGVEDSRGLSRAFKAPAPASAAAYGRPGDARGALVEPPGYEDARPLRMSQAPVGRAPFGGHDVQASSNAVYGGSAEPAGYEDARALLAQRGQHQRVPHVSYGGAAAALDEPQGEEEPPQAAPGGVSESAAPVSATVPVVPAPSVVSAPSAAASSVGVDDAWQEEDNESDLVAAPSEGDGDPLTIRRKFEILLPVADAVSGAERYTSVLASVEYDDPTHAGYQRVHHGLHWGIVQFTQRSGALGRVLRACERRDSMQFKQAFGGTMVEKLLQVTGAESPDARLLPVGGALLWAEPWLRTFREAGKIQAFQAAQNEVAIEHYFDRNLGFAAALGLMTDRALAMLFDRSVHMGLGGARLFVLSALSPLVDDATRATALAALGHADLAAFQSATGLTATGRLGSQTHAALLGALRALGSASPITLPTTEQSLDRLLAASVGRRFEQRLRALRTSTAFHDSLERVI